MTSTRTNVSHMFHYFNLSTLTVLGGCATLQDNANIKSESSAGYFQSGMCNVSFYIINAYSATMWTWLRCYTDKARHSSVMLGTAIARPEVHATSRTSPDASGMGLLSETRFGRPHDDSTGLRYNTTVCEPFHLPTLLPESGNPTGSHPNV
ncbi:hypothetical protein BC835DRAFT_397607 [Cytidiella melzeri]|nr:hypothetical protein BC835DRAFT_397607 [Cytidiella melzeri]